MITVTCTWSSIHGRGVVTARSDDGKIVSVLPWDEPIDGRTDSWAVAHAVADDLGWPADGIDIDHDNDCIHVSLRGWPRYQAQIVETYSGRLHDPNQHHGDAASAIDGARKLAENADARCVVAERIDGPDATPVTLAEYCRDRLGNWVEVATQ